MLQPDPAAQRNTRADNDRKGNERQQVGMHMLRPDLSASIIQHGLQYAPRKSTYDIFR